MVGNLIGNNTTMKIMKWIPAILMFFMLRSLPISGQSLVVYPGDVTDNGVVNNLDFLQLGMAYNFAGPPRDTTSQAFEPLPASAWSYQFASGQNMAFADCNGDGVVNYYYDAFPLYANYGKQRNTNVTPDVFQQGLPGVDPPLRFDHSAAPPSVQGGSFVRLPIELGTADLPVSDLYGLAFSFVMDPDLVDANSVEFNLSQASWANPDNDRIWFYKKVSDTKIDVAWVRIDRNTKEGFGGMGYVDFVIIVDLLPFQQQKSVSLQNIKMMDRFGNYSLLSGDTLWLTVPPDSAISDAGTPEMGPKVRVMPNPVENQVYVQSEATLQTITLLDLLGRVILSDDSSKQQLYKLELPELPDGCYLLRIETDQGVATRKIQKNHRH
jgi:hypothetical protein